MKQNSITARAIETGISTKTLHLWKSGGCNVHDDCELRERIGRTRHLPLNLKPEWIPRITARTDYEITPLIRFTACLDTLLEIAMDESRDKDERLAIVVFRINQMAEYIEAEGL